MFPNFALANTTDSIGGNAILLSQSLCFSVPKRGSANSADIFFGKFGVGLVRAFGRAVIADFCRLAVKLFSANNACSGNLVCHSLRTASPGAKPLLSVLLDRESLAATFASALLADMGKLGAFGSPYFLNGFWGAWNSTRRGRMAHQSKPDLFTMFWCIFQSQIRTSGWGDVKSLVPKRLEFAEPELLTDSQHFRDEHQFKDIEDKCLCFVLIKSTLHLWVGMFAMLEFAKMFVVAPTEIDSAPYVNFAIGGTSDAVNTRGRRNRGIHTLNYLSFSALFSCCQSGKATTFSSGLITPTLGNLSSIAFFDNCQKAEEMGYGC